MNGKYVQQGLYRREYEHDACGVGMVANLSGEANHDIVEKGMTILKRLMHRGATGNDPETGDGAGLLMRIPHGFFKKVLGKSLTRIPQPKAVREADALAGVRRRGAENAESVNLPYIYDLTNPAEEEQFVEKCREHLLAQMNFFEFLDKKAITEENFLDVFDYWDGLFGAYVRNGRKSSEYFFADIEQGKSIVAQDGQVLFSVSGAEGYIPKTIQPEKYQHFWQNYEKVPPPAMTRIRQKADRLTEDFRRRFTGEFYTPVEFAAKGLDYLERTVGREWWKGGEYRFWDMAAGTGNLEFELSSSALPYCYISTLEAEEARYCQKILMRLPSHRPRLCTVR